MLAIELIPETEHFARNAGFLAVSPKPPINLYAERPPGVLIACPDLACRERLVSLVKGKGLDAMFASKLTEASLLLKHAGITLVICQASFEDGDYRELLRATVGIGAVPPVIVCADWYEPGAYVEAIELGAFAYLTFPFRRDGLEEAVDKALDKLADVDHVSQQTKMARRENRCCSLQ